LEVLREADGPLGVGDVAARIGVHANTVRFHLDALVTSGAVEGITEPSSGRGRPRTVYAPRRGMDRGGQREYLLLARILLSRLASDEADAETAAVEAGRAWGGHLLPPVPPFRTVEAREAVERLTGLLADLGFDPAPVHGPPDRPADPTATADADTPVHAHVDADADDGGAADGAEAGRVLLRHCPCASPISPPSPGPGRARSLLRGRTGSRPRGPAAPGRGAPGSKEGAVRK